MKTLTILLFSIFLIHGTATSQEILNFGFSYNEDSCFFDSIYFDIKAPSSGTVGYSLHLNLFDANNHVVVKYLNGGLGGIGGGGTRPHTFYKIEVTDLEGIVELTEYKVAIYIPEFNKYLYESGQDITYQCETVLSVNNQLNQKARLTRYGENSFVVQSDASVKYTVNVLNLSGQVVMSSQESRISLDGLPKGIYLLELRQGDSTLQLKKTVVW